MCRGSLPARLPADGDAAARGAHHGRRLRKSLLEGHRPAGRAGHLQPLRPQDLRRAGARAARDRSLRAGLSGRAEAGGASCTRPIRAPAARTPMPRSSRPSGCSPPRARPAFRFSTPPRTRGPTACRRASPPPSASACRSDPVALRHQVRVQAAAGRRRHHQAARLAASTARR